MFTETMNSYELYQEYMADLPELYHRMCKFVDTTYVDKILYKARKTTVKTLWREQTTSRKSRYLTGFVFARQTKRQTWRRFAYNIGLLNTDKRMVALAFAKEEELAVKFTPHFFSRYKERMSEVCDWKLRNMLTNASFKDVMTLYLYRNSLFYHVGTKSRFRDKKTIFCPVPDGVALMEWDTKHETLQANTFITRDMLNSEQKNMTPEESVALPELLQDL